MKPGAELDALVAEKVMGLSSEEMSLTRTFGVKAYSTDISAAWEVVEKITASADASVMLLQSDDGEWTANWLNEDSDDGCDVTAYGDTAPHAICLAALKAVGVEVEVAA